MTLSSTLRKTGIAVLAAGVAFGLAVPTAALADPTSSGRTFQIAGSDTIQDVFNGITNGYTYNGTHSAFVSNLGSWDAFGSATITPKSGGQTFGRPAGSGDGVAALSAAWNPGNDVFSQTVSGVTTNYDLKNGVLSPGESSPAANDGVRELDFARSSATPATPVLSTDPNNKLTFVPFARDAVGVGYQSHVTTPGTNDASVTDLSTAALRFIYSSASTGTFTGSGYTISAGSGATDPVYTDTSTSKTRILQPVVPQSSSGTRKFFLSAIGVSAIGSWVTDAGEPENNATVLDQDGELVPFSAAQWIAQKNGAAPSTFGGTHGADVTLLDLNGVSPVTGSSPLAPNPSFFGSPNSTPSATFARDTYVVVPTANYSSQISNIHLLGRESYLDGTGTHYVVEDYGFERLNYSSTTGEYYSNWTN